MPLTTSSRPSKTRMAPAAVALLAGGSLGLSACSGSGAEPETAQARVNDTVPEVIDGFGDTVGLLIISENQ